MPNRARPSHFLLPILSFFSLAPIFLFCVLHYLSMRTQQLCIASCPSQFEGRGETLSCIVFAHTRLYGIRMHALLDVRIANGMPFLSPVPCSSYSTRQQSWKLRSQYPEDTKRTPSDIDQGKREICCARNIYRLARNALPFFLFLLQPKMSSKGRKRNNIRLHSLYSSRCKRR